MSIQEVLKAAIEAKGKQTTTDAEQKSKAKSLTEALMIARKKFLSEYPEARDASRLFRPTKQQQEKEAKDKRRKIRNNSYSSKNNFYSSVTYHADFARTMGAKEMKIANFVSRKSVLRMVAKSIKRGSTEVDALKQLSKKPNVKLNKAQKVKIMKSKRKKYL